MGIENQVGVQSLNNSSGSLSLVAGNNISLSSSASTMTIIGGGGGAAGTNSFSVGASSVSGTALGLSFAAAGNISLSAATAPAAMTITINELDAATVSFTQLFPVQEAGPILTSSSNAGSSLAIGSSFFLNRLFVPETMNLSEVDMALGLAYAATNSGAGTLSQSFVIYSFGNSTSLASVLSGGGSSTWGSGTATSAGAASITQFQQAWSGQFIRPMTFASSSLGSGEYVVGVLVNMSFSNASWSFSLYGGNAGSTTTGSIGAATAIGMSSLSAASTFTTGSSALTVFNSTPTSAADFANAGTQQLVVLSNSGTAGTIFAIATVSTSSFSSTSQISQLVSRTVFTAAPTAASRTVWSIAPTVNSVLSNSGTAGVSLALSMATASIAALTSVAPVIGSSTLTYGLTFLPGLSYQYMGTSSAIPAAVYPTAFDCGILSTGATIASIAVTATNMISTGSTAILQPWLALVGA